MVVSENRYQLFGIMLWIILENDPSGGHASPHMTATRFESLFADPYGAPALIRRLLSEHALRHRKLYITAFLMMGVAAACTALSAYLLGDVVNQAYVHRNFYALVLVGIAAFGIFALKGAATYGQQVIMMRIGNRIVADNQRHMF